MALQRTCAPLFRSTVVDSFGVSFPLNACPQHRSLSLVVDRMDTPRPLPNAEDLQRLVERFHRAHWITGVSMVSPEPFSMDFTLLGQRRIRQLFNVFDGATADNFPDQSDFHATESGRVLMDQFLEAMSELYPPHLSQCEKDMLLGLTVAFAKRQRW